MTTAALVRSYRSRDRAAGFSLIELLVVIGVIAILIGVLIPVAWRAQKSAKRTATANTLQVISGALEAYHADFGDYPRMTITGGNPFPNQGAIVLGKALIGGGPNYVAGTYNFPICSPHASTVWSGTENYQPGEWVSSGAVGYYCIAPNIGKNPAAAAGRPFWTLIGSTLPNDGADGPGFRTGAVNSAAYAPVVGKVYGPYLQPEKVQTAGLAILDSNGNAILYYAASLAKPNINVANGYIASSTDPTSSTTTAKVFSLYDASDNLNVFKRATETDYATGYLRFKALLGDTNLNGVIDNGETGITNPYLLWSAGPDGVFGPPAVNGAIPSYSDRDTVYLSGSDGNGVTFFNHNANAAARCDDATNFR